MSVPELRFPEFAGEWEESRLGEFMTFRNGVNADKSMYGHGRKFINVMDIIAGRPIISENIIGSVSVSDGVFGKNEVVYGDILFQRSSEIREETGQSNIYIDKDISATFGGFVIRGRPIVEFDPHYFDTLLKTDKARKDITNRSGGSTRFNVGQEALGAVQVDVAPYLPEQKKIAAFFGVVDDKIAALQDRQAGLERYKRGLMQTLFSQRLRFTKPDGTPFPDWEEKLLGEVAETTTGDSNREDSAVEGNYAFFDRSDDVRRSARYLFEGEAIIVAGEGSDFIPRYFVGKFDLHQRAYAIMNFQDAIGKFLYYWIYFKRHHFLSVAVGSTVPSLRLPMFQKFPLKFPHPEEQQRIADTLSAMDAKIQMVARQVAQMQALKKGLLQQMFV